MAGRPTSEQFTLLGKFLNECERAARPRPPTAPIDPRLSPFFFPQSNEPTLLGRLDYPTTLSELVWGAKLPFSSDEVLGPTRVERIAQFRRWLLCFPEFAWVCKQPAIESAARAFARVQARRSGDDRFTDDLAEFRFWRLAVFAFEGLHARNVPPPSAEQRQQAVAAAKKLTQLASACALSSAAGIDYRKWSTFLEVLGSMGVLASVPRRRRTDEHTADRRYVNLLAFYCWEVFGDASPSVICELAALKVKNPDKVAITKLVSMVKKQRKAALATV